MRFERLVLIGVTVIAAIVVFPQFATPQIPPQSGCADCHFADPRSPRRDHLEAWDRSPHARASIGCEKCHGGNPRTFEGFPAHSSIIDPTDVRSPVNRRHLPATCGTCHAGALAAFQGSRHYELLQSGSRMGPTCSTCHGEVEGRVLSPKALASECNHCHGPGEQAPRAERAREVRAQYEALTAVRQDMKLAQSLIKRVDDKKRRESLNEAYQQAAVPLQRAIDAGHQFVYADLREYLAMARARTDVLLSTLANR